MWNYKKCGFWELSYIFLTVHLSTLFHLVRNSLHAVIFKKTCNLIYVNLQVDLETTEITGHDVKHSSVSVVHKGHCGESRRYENMLDCQLCAHISPESGSIISCWTKTPPTSFESNIKQFVPKLAWEHKQSGILHRFGFAICYFTHVFFLRDRQGNTLPHLCITAVAAFPRPLVRPHVSVIEYVCVSVYLKYPTNMSLSLLGEHVAIIWPREISQRSLLRHVNDKGWRRERIIFITHLKPLQP